MLAKVTKRVRRRSEQECLANSIGKQVSVVDRPPDLVRWCSFSVPFPPVARGGYTKYYAGTAPKTVQTPDYCPMLSHSPDDKQTEYNTLPQSPLFLVSPPPLRSLGTICESSMESLVSERHSTLIDPTIPRSSLRRQRRRLLRTPSIERDFSVHTGHTFLSTASIHETKNSMDAPHSPHSSTHSHSSSSHSSSEHSDSTHSESNVTDSAHSEYPITPSTSIDSEDELGELGDSHFARLLYQNECAGKLLERPDSRSSFSTARSGFSDA